MFKLNKLFITVMLLGIMACGSNNSPKKDISNNKFTEVSLKYAKGFTIEKHNDYELLTIKNPWQRAEGVEYQYIFTNNDSINLPLNGDFTVVKTPVKKVVCLSTSHVAFIDILNETATIVAVSGKDFVNNELVRNGIENGTVKDVGYDNTLNYELIASLNPDIVITYGIGSQVTSYNQKLHELGIKTIIIAEYLEDHPLGKLEWIKLIASLFDKEELAKQYFEEIDREYNDLHKIAKNAVNKPRVLFGLPWKDVWYVPGGNSYLAKMVEDAGGDYIWNENQSRESIPLGIESIFVVASKADVWLNTGTVNSKEDILKMDKRFREFNPFNKALIYNNNLRVNQFGGNDYWEMGLVEPHVILKDMIKIFHPELLPDHKLVYHKKIE